MDWTMPDIWTMPDTQGVENTNFGRRSLMDGPYGISMVSFFISKQTVAENCNHSYYSDQHILKCSGPKFEQS